LETVHSYNPANGWLQSNSTPFSAAGNQSPKGKLPYMADGENSEQCGSSSQQGENYTLDKVMMAMTQQLLLKS
jgi:hypothetical protein